MSEKMDKWTEIENTYLTNQPARWKGRGKNRRCEPDPDIEPTELYLTIYDCERRPRSIRRKRRLHVLKGENVAELDRQLMDFTVREGVMLIESPDQPLKYVNSNAEPESIAIGA